MRLLKRLWDMFKTEPAISDFALYEPDFNKIIDTRVPIGIELDNLQSRLNNGNPNPQFLEDLDSLDRRISASDLKKERKTDLFHEIESLRGRYYRKDVDRRISNVLSQEYYTQNAIEEILTLTDEHNPSGFEGVVIRIASNISFTNSPSLYLRDLVIGTMKIKGKQYVIDNILPEVKKPLKHFAENGNETYLSVVTAVFEELDPDFEIPDFSDVLERYQRKQDLAEFYSRLDISESDYRDVAAAHYTLRKIFRDDDFENLRRYLREHDSNHTRTLFTQSQSEIINSGNREEGLRDEIEYLFEQKERWENEGYIHLAIGYSMLANYYFDFLPK